MGSQLHAAVLTEYRTQSCCTDGDNEKIPNTFVKNWTPHMQPKAHNFT
jgi:hypothetical protein